MIVGDRRLNHPFDPYGSLSALAVRRVEFTDRILHLIRKTSHLPARGDVC